MDDSSFFSIERLVEFGMSMAIAQQMVGSMNQTMNNMNIPGSFNSPQQSIFYAMIDGQQAGPLSENDIVSLINNKKIVNETYMWKPGMQKWDLAQNISDVVRIVALTPPPFK